MNNRKVRLALSLVSTMALSAVMLYCLPVSDVSIVIPAGIYFLVLSLSERWVWSNGHDLCFVDGDTVRPAFYMFLSLLAGIIGAGLTCGNKSDVAFYVSAGTMILFGLCDRLAWGTKLQFGSGD
ncbi:MAG: hypothetical protein WC797_00060 [Candidatus Paceibacterota bacterium]